MTNPRPVVFTCKNPIDVAVRVGLKMRIDPSGCWIWIGRVGRGGYGTISVDHKMIGSHRAAYLALRGDIQPGLVIDHLCRVRLCVNPWHMEPVTNTENVRRGNVMGKANPNRKPDKTHVCKPRGIKGCSKHGLEQGHFYVWPKNGRRMWICEPCVHQRNIRKGKRYQAALAADGSQTTFPLRGYFAADVEAAVRQDADVA